MELERLALFAYGSLVSPTSAAHTLGRDPREAGEGWGAEEAVPAELRGWRRRWSQARDNPRCEKTFALDRDGSVPDYVLGLNIERSGNPRDTVNGLLIAVSASELERLDVRELRYDRVDVGADIEPHAVAVRFERIVTYEAKPGNLVFEPPEGAVILSSYADAVEEAFDRLGPTQRELYLRTTGPYPVERVAAHLIRDQIPEGNPRDW